MAASMQRNVIDDFERIVSQLMSEAAAYVAGGQADEETEGNIRRLRLLSAGLNASLQSVQFMPRLNVPPPAPPDDAMVTPAQQPARR